MLINKTRIRKSHYRKSVGRRTLDLFIVGTVLLSGHAGLFASAEAGPSQQEEQPMLTQPHSSEEHDHIHDDDERGENIDLLYEQAMQKGTDIILLPLIQQTIPEQEIPTLTPSVESNSLPALAPGSVRYPSGAVFSSVRNPAGNIDYSDHVGNGEVLLIDLNGRRDEKLSANFIAREYQTKDGARYARISPELAKGLQRIRSRLGKSLTIVSGYRHKAYNKQVEGKPNSQHISGKAADISTNAVTSLRLAEIALEEMGCRIGIGLGKNTIHVDVRGTLASWAYTGAALNEAQFDAWVQNKCKNGGSNTPTAIKCLAKPKVVTRKGNPAYVGEFKTSTRCKDINVKADRTTWIYVYYRINGQWKSTGWKKITANRWTEPVKNLPDNVEWRMWISHNSYVTVSIDS